MKWPLVLLLSLLGVVMGYITLLHIGLRAEQFLWIVVYIISSLAIFRFAEQKFFLHGFVLGWLNCTCAYAIHMFYLGRYIANHPDIALLYARLEKGMNPYIAFAILDATKGVFYSLTSGVFAAVIGAGIKKLVNRV